MKVAYLTTYYNGAVDGRFGRFHDWVHTLRDMDDPPFDFEVVALSASNEDRTLSSPPHGVLGEATDMWGSPLNDVEYVLNIPRAVRDLVRLDFDVLHVLRTDLKVYPIALAFADRSPVIGPNVQGYVPGRDGERWNRGGLAGLRNDYEFRRGRALLRATDDPTLVALSRYHAYNVRKYDPPGVVETVPPGVDPCFTPGKDPAVAPSSSAAPDRPTRFLYVGDFSEYKGYDRFLDALAGLSDDLPVRATAIGSGDPSRDQIDALGLDETLTVEGFVPRENLPTYYREADWYVMPSVDENGPNTIVESLACGTPVVATNKPGINEYAPNKASIYVDREGGSLRRGLREAHKGRERYGKVALSRAEEFSSERTVAALAGLYERHLERTRD